MRTLIAAIIYCFICNTPVQAIIFQQSTGESTRQTAWEERINALLDSSRTTLYSDPQEAAEFGRQAVHLSEKTGNKALKAQSLLALGNAQFRISEYSDAVLNIKEAVSIFRISGPERTLASSLSALGNVYKAQGDYEQALAFYYESLAVCERIELQKGIGVNLNNIGLIYNEMEEYDKAMQYYLKSVEVNRAVQNNRLLAVNYNNLGLLHTSTGDLAKALKFHKKSLQIKRNSGNKIGEAYSLNNIAKVYLQQNKPDSARVYLEQSLLLNEQVDKDLAAISYELLAQIDMKKGAFEEALKHGRQSLVLAAEIGSLYGIQEAHKTLSGIFEQQGDMKNALMHFKDYSSTKDSLFRMQRKQEIAEMEARYNLSKKEKEIQLLEKEQEQLAFIQIALMIGIGLLGIVGYLGYRTQRLKANKKESELEVQRLKREKTERELELKRKQLTSQSLSMVQKNETLQELQQTVQNLNEGANSKELRNISHLVDYSFSLDESWKEFQLYFEESHTEFFHRLKERYPDLTPNEHRLAALVKLNLSIKEMAAIMGISPDSVKTARYRLRKKLGIETDVNLTDFMLNIEREALETQQ